MTWRIVFGGALLALCPVLCVLCVAIDSNKQNDLGGGELSRICGREYGKIATDSAGNVGFCFVVSVPFLTPCVQLPSACGHV